MSQQPSQAQLKQQLLRQAVEDNLAVREGRRRERSSVAGSASGRRRVGSRHRLLWLVAGILGVAALGVLGAWSTQPGAGAPAAGSSVAGLSPTGPGDGASAGDSSPGAAAHPGSEAEEEHDPTDAVDRALLDARFAEPQPIDVEVLPLEVRRIVIDPGHGGEDSGAVGHGLREKEITLDLARRLAEELAAEGYEIQLTRDDDTFLSLRERAILANQQRADLFVSIHVNWISERATRGVETYFLGSTDDPELAAIVRRENRDSGYSLADMRQLLDGIYTKLRQDESRQLASEVQRSLHSSLRRENPELVDRGVKTAPFVVLVGTEMPAILAEVSCLSNRDEAELLARPLYREHIAKALARGIGRYADRTRASELRHDESPESS